MFVLMVAVLPPLLSDRPPQVRKRAGFGDRFHYFRGVSGRRYLFSAVGVNELADFRSAVVMIARRAADGRMAAHAIAVLDGFGRPLDGIRPWPPVPAPSSVVLVHLLSATEAERFDLVDDLAGTVEASALAA